MGHHITALVGKYSSITELSDQFGPPRPTELPFELVLLPLGHERLDELCQSDEPVFDGFVHLSPGLVDAIGRATSGGRVLYFETDYFGGIGSQAAALFEDGRLVWRDSESTEEDTTLQVWTDRLLRRRRQPPKSPISRGLEALGVQATADDDEFDRVGLGRFRSLESLGLEEYPDDDD